MEPTPRKSRRKRWLIGVTTLVFVIVLPIALFKYQSWKSHKEWNEAVAETDANHPGWRWGDVEGKREVLPDEHNGAAVVMRIKTRKLLPAGWPPHRNAADFEPALDPGLPGGHPDPPNYPQPTTLKPEPLPMPDEFDERDVANRFTYLPPEIRPDARTVKDLKHSLAMVQDALHEALKLTDLPQGRYPLQVKPDFFSTILECQEARRVAALLQLESYRRSEAGDISGALVCIRACLNMARSIGDEPITISQLVRMAIDTIAVQQLERTLAQGQPSDAELALIQKLLEEEALVPRMLFSIRGERAGWTLLIEALIRGEIPTNTLTGLTGAPTGWIPILERPARVLYRRWGADLLRALNEAIEIINLPPEQWTNRFKLLDKKVDAMRDGGSILVGLLLPTLEKVATAEQRTLAYLRTAATAVAAERYRIAKGFWPASLDDLVKAGLIAAVPTDPFDGKPLRLTKSLSGITVYSIGPDLTDDGGIIDRKKPNGPKSDSGFRVFDATCRRMSAEPLPMPREPKPGE